MATLENAKRSCSGILSTRSWVSAGSFSSSMTSTCEAHLWPVKSPVGTLSQRDQGGTFDVAAAEAAVAIRLGQADPAFGGLAFDVGLGRFPLCLAGSKFLLGALLDRLARVDGTTQRLDRGGLNRSVAFLGASEAPRWFLR